MFPVNSPFFTTLTGNGFQRNAVFCRESGAEASVRLTSAGMARNTDICRRTVMVLRENQIDKGDEREWIEQLEILYDGLLKSNSRKIGFCA